MRRLAWLICLVAVSCSSPHRPSAQRVVSTPVATTLPAPTTTEQSRSAATLRAPAPTTPPPAPPTPMPTAPPLSQTFSGLGSWIDVFDYTNEPNTIVPLVRGMAERGVNVLYLETARYQSATDIQFPAAVGAGLDEAKALGMGVVAWYPPPFDDVERDLRRSIVAIQFVSPKGNHFDGFAADIEYTERVPNHADRTRRTIDYSRQLRTVVGTAYPMAGIVIAPTSLQRRPDRWPGFPWGELGALYDVIMPMNYWTTVGKDPATVEDLTRRNTSECRRLTGRPVHIIGGLGEYADDAQVLAYVAAAREAGSIGGGLYDYATTRSEVWDRLRLLAR